jgi:hypothetical protein
MTYKSIYQILFIANEYAAIQQDYGLIARYINRTNEFMKDQAYKKKSYLFYQISISYIFSELSSAAKGFCRKRILSEGNAGSDGCTDSRYYARFFTYAIQLLSALKLFFTGFVRDAIALLQKFALQYNAYL